MVTTVLNQAGPPPDIKTLFHDENERRKRVGGTDAALTVSIPQWCELETNYRTHQGILDSAALLVVSLGGSHLGGLCRIHGEISALFEAWSCLAILPLER
jgi:hypothetical protein